MAKCMICGQRSAKAFGPYKEDDLLCESCATDPREAHERLKLAVRNGLLVAAGVAIVVWALFWLFAEGR